MDRADELTAGIAHLDELIAQTQAQIDAASGEELRALSARLLELQGKRRDAADELEGLNGIRR